MYTKMIQYVCPLWKDFHTLVNFHVLHLIELPCFCDFFLIRMFKISLGRFQVHNEE